MRSIVSFDALQSKGSLPASMTYRMTPRLHASLARENIAGCAVTSGAT
jgi:hypothetical protein